MALVGRLNLSKVAQCLRLRCCLPRLRLLRLRLLRRLGTRQSLQYNRHQRRQLRQCLVLIAVTLRCGVARRFSVWFVLATLGTTAGLQRGLRSGAQGSSTRRTFQGGSGRCW